MYELRQRIKEIWDNYAAGYYTFAATSHVTETGFAITYLAEERFLEVYPGLQDFSVVFDQMHISVSTIAQTCLVFPERYVILFLVFQFGLWTATFQSYVTWRRATKVSLVYQILARSHMARH